MKKWNVIVHGRIVEQVEGELLAHMVLCDYLTAAQRAGVVIKLADTDVVEVAK